MATQSVKDILDTEVPKPSFVLSPSVPAPLPSEMPFGESGTGTGRSGKDNVARTLDPYSGKFEQVGEDTPRVYGSDQGLLVEASRRTNHVNYSADYTEWANDDTTINFASSILGGENATAYQIINTGSQFDSVQAAAGSFSSSMEVIWSILEEGNSTSYEVGTRDTNNFNTIGGFIYDLQDDKIFPTGISNTISVNKRTITNNGPNGGKVVLCVARYDPTDGVSVSGAGREAQHYPDNNGNSGNAIVHQTQIEEAPNASSPIVTGSSAKTRAGDDYKINIGDWWNPNEGTFIIKAQIPAYAQNNVYFLTQGSDQKYRYLYTSDNNPPYTLSSFDGSNLINSSDNVDPFEFFTYGVSFTGSKITASLNGVSSKTNHNKNLLLNDNKVIGINDNLIANIGQIIYYPRALPESTLNVLTS